MLNADFFQIVDFGKRNKNVVFSIAHQQNLIFFWLSLRFYTGKMTPRLISPSRFSHNFPNLFTFLHFTVLLNIIIRTELHFSNADLKESTQQKSTQTWHYLFFTNQETPHIRLIFSLAFDHCRLKLMPACLFYCAMAFIYCEHHRNKTSKLASVSQKISMCGVSVLASLFSFTYIKMELWKIFVFLWKFMCGPEVSW